MNNVVTSLALQLKLKEKQITSVLDLLGDGSTVPFIARYRKEATGNLDEDQIRLIEKEYKYQTNLVKRKEEIIRLINEKKMLTKELEEQINQATKLQVIEDLYLPYKEKRKTKATEAIKHGLQPLADYINNDFITKEDLEKEALKYLSDEVLDINAAIIGASYIIAENISDTAIYREYVRKNILERGILRTKVKRGGIEKDQKSKYEMYYDFSQPIKKLPSYRVLAFNRGEKEKILNVTIDYDNQQALDFIASKNIKNFSQDKQQLFNEINLDAFERLIFPSIEREIRTLITKKGEEQAIKLFAENLDVLILQSPLKNKTILCIDPAFRTGCKLAVIDETGAVLNIDVVYPHEPRNDHEGTYKKFDELFKKYPINLIVGGNGTASRETETLVKEYKKSRNLDIDFNIVSEAGASVYSASKVAQEEFPDLQVEQRSAVSIGRRVQDPMAELVKIDPKSIGVGQYQHDVNQKELSESLDFIMLKNINRVGIDVNTASAELLKYVSGLDKTIAKNIIIYRQEIGHFTERKQLKHVKRLGPKAYEQSAGFLKVFEGKEILDTTFIHPESYKLATLLLKELAIDKKELGTPTTKEICKNVNSIEIANTYKVSEFLIRDILNAFSIPNIDIRDKMQVAKFDSKVTKIEDLKLHMKVQGQVRNIVDFGAFVDIGLKNDALIHVSQISNKFVSQVSDFLKIGDVKEFIIKDLDIEKGRIQLTLKEK